MFKKLINSVVSLCTPSVFRRQSKKLSNFVKVEPPNIVGFIDISELQAAENYKKAYKRRNKKK
jgi:hypothetical protein